MHLSTQKLSYSYDPKSKELSGSSIDAKTFRIRGGGEQTPSANLLLQTELQASAQALKATEILLLNIGGDRIRRRAVVGVAGEIAVLNHQHP